MGDYEGPASLPAPREGQIPGHSKSVPTGSLGGPVMWFMREAFMPSLCTCYLGGGPSWMQGQCKRHSGAAFGGDGNVDPDGFAVSGRYPKGWLAHILKLRLLGDVRRDDILHVCSGTLGPSEKWTVDLRRQAKPRVVANGCALPFRDASFAAALLDPPYSDQYARNLYGTQNPRPSWLLREAARVVMPNGRIGLLHVAVPFAPPDCWLVGCWGVTTGVGFRIRALTVYQRHQAGLPLTEPQVVRNSARGSETRRPMPLVRHDGPY